MPATCSSQPVEACRPWYETSPVYVNSTPPCTNQDTNPYLCTLRINVPGQDVTQLRDLYTPLLQWIDPVFQLVRIEEDNIHTSSRYSEDRNGNDGLRHHARWRVPSTGLITQALSIVLFLRNDGQSQLTATGATRYLQSTPWQFHHKIELTNRVDLRAVARQEYFASTPGHDLPLWSVCPIHFGSEQLRFNIFVKNFNGMKNFYGTLLSKSVSASKPGFCLFQIYTQPGLEIQLSLKYSPCLLPEPTRAAALSFRVKNISHLQEVLPHNIVQYEEGTWVTRDVDGNTVFLSRDTLQNTSQKPQVV